MIRTYPPAWCWSRENQGEWTTTCMTTTGDKMNLTVDVYYHRPRRTRDVAIGPDEALKLSRPFANERPHAIYQPKDISGVPGLPAIPSSRTINPHNETTKDFGVLGMKRGIRKARRPGAAPQRNPAPRLPR